MPFDPSWDQREIEDFDWADRWNGRFVRAAAVGFPVWILLLLILGWAGGSALAGLVVASFLAVVVVLVLDRVFARKTRGWDDNVARQGALGVLAAIVLVPTFAGIALWIGGDGAALAVIWGSLTLLPVAGLFVAIRSTRRGRPTPPA